MHYQSNSILYSLISKTYLLTALFLFSLTSNASTNANVNINTNNTNHYHPNLETSYKVGNVRQIGRASILLPIWQKEDQLLYFNAIGMMDNKNNQEGNFGFGYRRILNNKDIILGIFIHYDRKSSPNDNVFNQGALGLELFSEIFEGRLNGYVSFSKIKVLNEETKIGATLRHTPANVFIGNRYNKDIEAPLHGFDAEIGARLGSLPASIYGGYYYFNRAGAKRVSGPSGRLDIKLTNWLSLGGEVKYDEIRKLQYYVGLNLRFSNSKESLSPYSLRSKMTQMPLRDVDVVTIEKGIVKEDERPLILIEKGGIDGGIELANLLHEKPSPSRLDLLKIFVSTLVSPYVDHYNVSIGLAQDVIMPEGYQPPESLTSATIIGLNVSRKKNNGGIEKAEYKKRKIKGLETQLLNKITDSKVSYLIIDSGRGLVKYACGKSEILYNENHGDITNDGGFGIVMYMNDSSQAIGNINCGDITRDGGFGIVGDMNNRSQAIGNINLGEVSGDWSAGVVRKMNDSSQAIGNINLGEVSGQYAAGVVREMNDSSQATGNINYGEASGVNASGVVCSALNSSQVTGNINYGKVSVSRISGPGGGHALFNDISELSSSGIVLGAHDNSQVTGNINLGNVSGTRGTPIVKTINGLGTTVTNNIILTDDGLASPASLNAKGIKLMEAKDIEAPWFLGQDYSGRNIIIPGGVAKIELYKALRNFNRLVLGGMIKRTTLSNDAAMIVAKQAGNFSYLPDFVLSHIVAYASLPFPKDDKGKVQARATKEEFLRIVLGGASGDAAVAQDAP